MKRYDLSWLEAFRADQPNFGLERMKKLLQLRNNPQLNLPVIHIAGTNGKGSTIAHLNHLLQSLGLKVGVFSSPYLIDYRDQLTINDQSISEVDLEQLFEVYRNLLPQHQEELLGLTEFEIITAMSFDYFRQQEVDVALIEVGMGGLLDSTNVCQPILTAITTIGLDHVALLGDSIEQITRQKAGIIKPEVPVILGRLPEEAQAVMAETAAHKQAPLVKPDKDYRSTASQSLPQGELFNYESQLLGLLELSTPLLGQQQVDNASLALTIFSHYCLLEDIPLPAPENIQAALTRVHWPGRMEILSSNPTILIDGAHNPHAMERLVANLNSRYPDQKKQILFACIQTKEVQTMLDQLQAVTDAQITLTSFDDSRAIPAQRMQELAKANKLHYRDWQTFLKKTIPQDQILVLTGSLYFLAQVRPHLLKEKP